jgi:hypothetical protein
MLKFFNNKKISYLALALIIGAIIVLLLVSSCNPSYIYTHPGDTIQAGLDSVEKVLPSKPAPRQFLDLEALKEHAIAKIRRQQREILESYNLSKPYLPKNYKLVIYDLTLLPLKLVDFFFSKQGAVLARDPYHFVIFSPEKVDFSPEAKAFRWVAREGRKLINSDKGLVLSESLGTKIKYYEYTNMTHFTYNSFLYHFCGMYPVSLSRESVTLNG